MTSVRKAEYIEAPALRADVMTRSRRSHEHHGNSVASDTLASCFTSHLRADDIKDNRVL
eukprot:CAMPEP_0174899912 /NCGR_PEP_ID=MMETSP0167-20121228/29141_1 /TAXON_ID=38298 /ORGANISM="Rhodella maculata, Strain CCMP736" /LENGTH=58 /DNA_ID=CAMNT_0016141085 /DNA_START=77 /DNA_END=250 /DNA_ORIENTATION=+